MFTAALFIVTAWPKQHFLNKKWFDLTKYGIFI